jgi:hypothetical protein
MTSTSVSSFSARPFLTRSDEFRFGEAKDPADARNGQAEKRQVRSQ